MDKNYILAFEDSPCTSINFRVGDMGLEAQQRTRKQVEESDDFIT